MKSLISMDFRYQIYPSEKQNKWNAEIVLVLFSKSGNGCIFFLEIPVPFLNYDNRRVLESGPNFFLEMLAPFTLE